MIWYLGKCPPLRESVLYSESQAFTKFPLFWLHTGGQELPCPLDQAGGETRGGSVSSEAHVPSGDRSQWSASHGGRDGTGDPLPTGRGE